LPVPDFGVDGASPVLGVVGAGSAEVVVGRSPESSRLTAPTKSSPSDMASLTALTALIPPLTAL
jgi:hypothetical protein